MRAVLILTCCIASAFGQNWTQGPWVPNGIANAARDIATFDEGSGPRLFVGGPMFSAGGVTTPGLARWDGSTWSDVGGGVTFNSGGWGHVYMVEPLTFQGTTALYVGGQFDIAGGLACPGIARWDGATWTSVGGGINGFVYDAVVFDDGTGERLYVAGTFSMAGGVAAANVVAFDGVSWTPVGAGLPGTSVEDLEIYDDGNGSVLYAGGRIPSGVVQYWDGTNWIPIGPNGGLFSYVSTLEVHDDGTGSQLYAGGFWSSGAGNAVSRWDGTSWSGVGMAYGVVAKLESWDDGTGARLAASGTQLGAPGLLTRLGFWDGSSWTRAVADDFNGSVLGLGKWTNGSGTTQLVAGGLFDHAGSVPAAGIARFTGTTWRGMPDGPTGTDIRSMTSFRDPFSTSLYVGTERSIHRWNGQFWIPMGNTFQPTFYNEPGVDVVKAFYDGNSMQLVAGGQFLSNSGQVLNGLAVWNGTQWVSVGGGVTGGAIGGEARVEAMVMHDDGTGPALYVMGPFTSAGGSFANGIARWDGTGWSTVGAGLAIGAAAPNQFPAMEVYDGDLYVGGAFSILSFINNFARWDGAAWSTVGFGVTGNVYDLQVFDDGTGPQLYIGGAFSMNGAMGLNDLVRWDGTAMTAIGTTSFPHAVSQLEVFDDGSGSALFVFPLNPTDPVMRWDGSAWTTEATFADRVRTTTVMHDATGARLTFAGNRGLLTDAAGSLGQWAFSGGLSLTASQPGGMGTPVSVTAGNLVIGHPIHFLVSTELCPTVGTGPYLGLCASSAAVQSSLLNQFSQPVGSVFHPLGLSTTQSLGTFTVPPGTYDAVIWDPFQGLQSDVLRITVQ